MSSTDNAIREQLALARSELARIDNEREVVINAIQSLEAWLRLRLLADNTIALVPDEAERNGKGRNGRPASFRGAILQVLSDAQGAPLHSKEILERAEAMGAATGAKDKVAAVDLTCHGLKDKGVERSAPRTWRIVTYPPTVTVS